MSPAELIEHYVSGPQMLAEAIAGMTPEQLDAAPVAGKWSTRQVICHIADFEPVYADRMKRVIVEDNPTMFGGNPDDFAARLAYAERELQSELEMIAAVRRHVAGILRTLDPEDFTRTGQHSVDGPISLAVLLKRITNHIPHHLRFIEEKKAQLGL